MDKATAMVLIAMALVLGIFIGALGAAMVIDKAAKQIVRDDMESGIDSLLSKADAETEALTYLRSSQTTNAVKSLDDNLETDLIRLDPYAAISNEFKSDSWRMETLRKIKDYRTQFPYKTNPDVEKDIDELLDLSNTETNH